MRLHALHFSDDTACCPWLYFIEQMKLQDGKLTSGQEIAKEADVILFNLTHKNLERFFQIELFKKKAKKIAFVSELSHANLSVLKTADFVFYRTQFQKQFVEDYFGLKYPSEVMAHPCTAYETGAGEECFLYFKNEFDIDLLSGIKRQFKKAMTGFGNQTIRRFQAVFRVKPENEPLLNSFLEDVSLELGIEVDALNADRDAWGDILASLSRCKYGEFISHEFQVSEFHALLAEKSHALLYQEFESSPIVSEMAGRGVLSSNPQGGVSGPLSVKYVPVLSPTEAYTSITAVFDGPGREKRPKRAQPDRLEELNIIQGKVLTNRYVFSVCFRNQENKLERCLTSIAKQHKDLDFGIAVVDDGSDDRSAEVAREVLGAYSIDHVIVSNRERKYASRNFYNVIHLLTANPQGVIIEMDGDDFLSNRDVLEEIDAKYREGYVKTCGSFRFYPDEFNFKRRQDKMAFHNNLDFKQPWNIVKCNAWLPLRTCARRILELVEIEYFLNRNDGSWLTSRHDSAIQPRVIELCEGKICKIGKVLYVYDLSGDNHDHADGSDSGEEHFTMIKNLGNMHHPFIIDRIVQKERFSFY